MKRSKRNRVINLLVKKQASTCCYCNKLVYKSLPERHPDSLTIEHLKRKADGGTDCIDNLAICCYDCNTGRGTMDWFTYASYKRGELFLS